VKVMGQVLAAAIFFVSLCGLTITQAKAAGEFCPATLDLKPVGSGTQNKAALYGFTLNAGASKIISGILAFETASGWYSASVPNLTITPTVRHFIDPDGTHRALPAWTSPVMYVRFSQPVALMNAFVLGANAEACPPQPRWALVPKTKARPQSWIRNSPIGQFFRLRRAIRY